MRACIVIALAAALAGCASFEYHPVEVAGVPAAPVADPAPTPKAPAPPTYSSSGSHTWRPLPPVVDSADPSPPPAPPASKMNVDVHVNFYAASSSSSSDHHHDNSGHNGSGLVHVRAYTRHTKSGKTVYVHSYTRRHPHH